jgi:hypothetical protein
MPPAATATLWLPHRIGPLSESGVRIGHYRVCSPSELTPSESPGLAAYDCARWLNGRGVGARYDGKSWSKDMRATYADSLSVSGTYPGSSQVGVCWPFTGDGSSFSKWVFDRSDCDIPKLTQPLLAANTRPSFETSGTPKLRLLKIEDKVGPSGLGRQL